MRHTITGTIERLSTDRTQGLTNRVIVSVVNEDHEGATLRLSATAPIIDALRVGMEVSISIDTED